MMPSTIIDAELGQYEVLADFKLGFAPIRMLKLRSKVTGLRVVVADYKAPIVSAFCGNSGDTAAGIDPQSYVQMQLNAYAVLATETFDDSGLPHTLEHLTFMGSESYPYKGVLDLLAGRAGADGLSAWTAIDHTAYTISSAGSEGFLNMLPVYLEHILYPTLTKEAFLSEIYHVDENGEEGGVVFSEMQGIEQKSDRILSRHADRMAHPSGSGYGSVTGGLLEDLRQLDVERIRRYHDQYYKPWNLCLHVDGSVPLPQLLEVLNNVVDPMIMAKSGGLTNARPPPEWQRPFVDTISATGPIIDADFKTIVPFMADDESLGEAILKWKGPETGQRMLKTALNVLTTYLNHSEVAPLSKQLMEIKEPACISIEFSIEDYATKCMINCFIKGVPQSPEQGTASRLYHIDAEVKAVFIDVTQRGLDLKRMKAVIMKQSRMLLKKAEDDVTELLIPETIDDFLYSVNDDDLAVRVDIQEHYKTLLSWTNQQWIELLHTYFVANPSIVIIGKPSASLTKQVEEDGKQWLLALNSRLGKQGLQERADALAAAEKANHREIPSDMLTNFPLSDAGKIAWVPVESGLNSSFPGPEQTAGRIQAYLDADITELPYFVHFSHVESNFITVRVMLDTSRIPEDCRPYLALYLESFFALPIRREERILQYEQVVEELTDFAVSYDIGLSLDNNFEEIVHVSLVVEKSDYARAVGWLRDLLARSIFEQDRIEVIIRKLIQKLPGCCREPMDVLATVLSSLIRDKAKSTSEATGLWNRISFLPNVGTEVERDPNSVIDRLSLVRDLLIDPRGMRLSVAGDILNLAKPRTAWTTEFLSSTAVPLRPLPDPTDTMTALGISPSRKAVIVPIGSMEGSNASVYSRGPQGWSHSELPACIVTAALLDTTESYFWKGIRGAGLAYHTSINVDEEYGSLVFRVARSPNCVKAVLAAGSIVQGLVDGSVVLDVNTLDGARSSLAYKYAKKERNVSAAAMTVMVNEVLKGIPAKANADFLASLAHVTVHQVKAALLKHFLPLFDPNSSVMAVTCGTGLVQRIKKDLEDSGYHVEIRQMPKALEEDD